MKNTLLFTYNTNILVRLLTINIHKYEELSYPQNPKMCDPIQVTMLKKQPRYSQTSCENATPSSDTSPLASNKEVQPPPPPGTEPRFNEKTKSSLYRRTQTRSAILKINVSRYNE